MLNQITISNYAIVDQLDLEISPGMTVITGETGAGKSIMLDALSLTLGGRADSDCVRTGVRRADIQARFDLDTIPAAQQWLKEKDYDTENSSECVLRRVITREGRSRAYINGTPATLTELKSIGSHLIDIHSQHAHQSLLNKSNHSTLLDHFAQSTHLAQKVSRAALEHHRTSEVLKALVSQQQEREERIQLLSYQLQELEQINLQPGEAESLEAEQQQQSQADNILTACHQVAQICGSDDGNNLIQQLSSCLHKLSDLQMVNAAINNCLEMLSSAQIQVEEAAGELNQFIDHFEVDPEKAQFIEERLSAIYELARKHRIQPEELLARQQQIKDELRKIQHHDEQVLELEANLKQHLAKHQKIADQLSKKRKSAAHKLEKQVTE
ncbi:MAG: DNA repair protein RecN, partial [Endozoicomonas sp.]